MITVRAATGIYELDRKSVDDALHAAGDTGEVAYFPAGAWNLISDVPRYQRRMANRRRYLRQYARRAVTAPGTSL